MTAGFVADSSVAVAWVVEAQSNEATEHLLKEIGSGTPFVVPALWMFEVANALLILARRRKIDAEECSRARRSIGDLTPIVDDEGIRLTLGITSELAQKCALTIYDATYLEVSLRRGLPLASRDAALNKAAKLSGIKTLLLDR